MSVASLHSALSAAKRKLNDYHKRRREVEKIQKKIDNDFSDNTYDIGRKMMSVASDSTNGIRETGGRTLSNVMAIDEKLRKGCPSLADFEFADMRSGISKELIDIDNRIRDLEWEIRSLEIAIAEAEAAEAAEAAAKAKK